jgi:hypothetical protein
MWVQAKGTWEKEISIAGPNEQRIAIWNSNDTGKRSTSFDGGDSRPPSAFRCYLLLQNG